MHFTTCYYMQNWPRYRCCMCKVSSVELEKLLCMVLKKRKKAFKDVITEVTAQVFWFGIFCCSLIKKNIA